MSDDAPQHGPDYVLERRARSGANLLLLAALGLTIWLLHAMFQVLPVILTGLALFALPIIHDIGRDHRSGLRLSTTDISWTSATRTTSIPLKNIEKVRFTRALDFTSRVTFHLTDGQKLRLPRECYGAPGALKTALAFRSIRVEPGHKPLTDRAN